MSELELDKNSMGFSESVVMGVAGTAPAFSIAATTGTLIAAVGHLSVASLLYCGLIMFGITIAYLHLNRIHTHAGAAYAWVGLVFHPVLGFFAGWSLLVASAVFMVSGTIPAATSTLALFSDELPKNITLVSVVAACWLILVGAIIIKGTKLAAIFQVVNTLVEFVSLVLIIGGIFWFYWNSPAHSFTREDFAFTEFTPELFASGALVALFFFWGWDVTLNLSEETAGGEESSGRGAIWAMIIMLVLFMASTAAVQLSMSDAEIEKAGTNVLLALAQKVFPDPYSYIAVIAVLLSTVGTLETTILQFTSTMFAKGRDGVLHPRYAVLHAKWKTPWVSTLVIVAIGLVLLFFATFLPNVNTVIDVSVKAIGFLVAFYYGLTGFACAWLFRKKGQTSIKNFIMFIFWPVVSAAFMAYIIFYSVKTFDLTTTLLGVGGILFGIIPLVINRIVRKNQVNSRNGDKK